MAVSTQFKRKKLPNQPKRGPKVATIPAKHAKSNESSNSRKQSSECDSTAPEDDAQTWSVGSPRVQLTLLAMASALALWASFPPLGLGWLGWIAPAGWIAVAHREKYLRPTDYGILWLSGALFWLATMQGVRLAYWPMYFGWVALSCYLAIYVPLFVGVTRILTRQDVWGRRIPLVVAAPVAWVGFEMLRCYLLTGFCAGMLVHTQVRYPLVIQLADQLGGYGVGFVMMTACAALILAISCWKSATAHRALPAMGWTLTMVATTFAYGYWRLNEADTRLAEQEPLLKVLIVQENMPTMFDSNVDDVRISWTNYLKATRELTQSHLRDGANNIADLVVWPESTFTGGIPWVESTLRSKLPEALAKQEYDLESVKSWTGTANQEFKWKVNAVLSAARGLDALIGGREGGESERSAAAEQAADGATSGFASEHTKPCLLLGSDAMEIGEGYDRFNSALIVAADGSLIGRYDKMHLVMFGEYIPLGPLLKWLGDMFGLSGATPGEEPKCFQVNGAWVAPNICFESMMPRVISRQVRRLGDQGVPPDLLINLTNDSWFRGSSILEHHLACSIVSAVENRRPFLVAANSGISAQIDGCGRVVQSTDRYEVAGIWAEPVADARWGLVQSAGYPLGWTCAVVVVLALGRNLFGGRQRSRLTGEAKTG